MLVPKLWWRGPINQPLIMEPRMEASMWVDKMQRYLEQCCHNHLMRRINYTGLYFLCREKKMRTLPATCYKCRNTDRQGVSRHISSSSIDCVATWSNIRNIMISVISVDDNCYKLIPIYKGTWALFPMYVANVASVLKSNIKNLALCFYYIIFIFWRFHEGGITYI